MKDFLFSNAVDIIKQSDAFIINGELVAPVIEEKTLTNGYEYFRTIIFFWGTLLKSENIKFYEDSEIKFDGQTFEIKDKYGYEWTLVPLLKLKKWEDY